MTFKTQTQAEGILEVGIAVAGLAIAEVDYATGKIHMPPAAAQMFGLGESEITVPRERVHATFHPLDQSELEKNIAAALDPNGPGWFSMEHRILLPNGNCRWLRVRKQVRFDRRGPAPRPSSAILAALNVTQEKNIEAALRQANEDWKLFGYGASHDLKAPLRTITIFNQILLEKYGAHLDAEAVKMLQISVESARRMSQLIADLLQFAEVSHVGDYVNETPVDTALALEKICEVLQQPIQESGASVVHSSGLPQVLVAPVHIEQLLQNLLSNALNYRKDGVAPVISVSAVPRGEYWQFSVQDNGIGIPAEHQAQVFGLFQRLHARGNKASGSGVGLTICQKIVERYGGRIWLDSQSGEGTAVHFTLPGVGANTANAAASN